MTIHYAVVDNTTGIVQNVIWWDGESDYTPPQNCMAIQTNVGGVGWLYANGVFTAPSPPALTPLQQYENAMSNGVVITSASTPSLNGIYACDANAVSALMAEVQSQVLFQTFTNQQTSIVWPISGGTVTLTSAVQIEVLARAIAQYVSGWTQFINGTATTPPSTNAVTIP